MALSLTCPKCEGDGAVASTPTAERWSYWQTLGSQGGLCVRMGLVRKVTCPICQGLGLVVTL